MAYEIPGKLVSIDTNVDHTLNQYKFVKTDGALAGDGEKAYPLQDHPDGSSQERAAAIMLDGISKITAGAAFVKGAKLASDANGDAITAVAGKEVLGEAFEAAGGAGEVTSMIVDHAGIL